MSAHLFTAHSHTPEHTQSLAHMSTMSNYFRLKTEQRACYYKRGKNEARTRQCQERMGRSSQRSGHLQSQNLGSEALCALQLVHLQQL